MGLRNAFLFLYTEKKFNLVIPKLKSCVQEYDGTLLPYKLILFFLLVLKHLLCLIMITVFIIFKKVFLFMLFVDLFYEMFVKSYVQKYDSYRKCNYLFVLYTFLFLRISLNAKKFK